MIEEVYAFGEKVPQSFLNEVIEEYGIENANTDFIETLLWWEYQDNR